MIQTEKISIMIKQILADICKKGNVDFDAVNSFYEEGYLDSVRIMELIVAMEEKFDFEFWDNDLLFKNFDTVESICNLVIRRIDENKF